MYTNLDGIKAEPKSGEYVEYITKRFPHVHPVRGKLTGSELEMHTHKVGRTAIIALCREADVQKATYAYVLLDDGTFLDGSFHIFSDGSVTLS